MSLLKSTSIIGFMTLLSRVSGLVRDVVFANVLGDKAVADIFLIAFRLPNFFRRIFGEGAYSAAFIPVFTDYRQQPSEQSAFLQLMLGWFSSILLVFCIIAVWFMPQIISVLAPGFMQDPEQFASTVAVSRVTFPYLFFISLVAMSAAMLNTCGRFAAPAATPILLNISLIFAAWLVAPSFANPPMALALGVLVGGVVQLLFQWPFLRKEGLLERPRLRPKASQESAMAGVKQVFRLMLPALFGASVAQVNVLINTLLASFMATGSIAWLYYADRLMEFPLGVFGIALGTAILPTLAKRHSAADATGFSDTLNWALRWGILIGLPAMAGLCMLAVPLVATIYFHGSFTEHGVSMTAYALVAYATGLPALVLVKILAPGFFAQKNTKTPVKIGIFSMVVNIVMSLILYRSFQHIGLAIASSIAAWANAGLLYFFLRGHLARSLLGELVGFIAKILLASIIMCGLLFLISVEPAQWLQMPVISRIATLGFNVILGLIAFALAVFLLGLRPRHLQQQ